MKTRNTEVLVIGSGFGAAPLALRLAQAGQQVTMIEKGPAIDPYSTFRQTQDPGYLMHYLHTLHGDKVSFNYIEAEGGGSGFYEMMSFRAPSDTFVQRDEQHRPLWPEEVNRSTLDPWYQLTENMLNVHQIPYKDVPKTGQVFAKLMQHLGYSADRIQYAVKDCLNCGRCVTGCIFGAKQSLLLTYLPRARNAGMQFHNSTEALNIRTLKHSKYKYSVLCRDEEGQKVRFNCQRLVVAAGAVGTAAIMLASRRHLRKLSPQVGRNVAFNGSVKTASLLPDWCPDGDLYTGRSNPGVVSYEFYKDFGLTITPAKPFPLQISAVARIQRKGDGEDGFWGRKHVELMKRLRHRGMFMVAFGRLPGTGQFTLRRKRLRLTFDQQAARATQFYHKGHHLLHGIIKRSGGELLDLKFMSPKGTPYEELHFTSAHQVGSCRMADSPSRGVVDPNGQVFGYPGMYITDGSALSSSIGMGPSLTILANAERIANEIVSTG